MPRDYSNLQLQNFALHNVTTDAERGIPVKGKLVYRVNQQWLELCVDESPNSTTAGGGTWVGSGEGAITYIGSGGVSVSTGTSSTPPLHASTQQGDLLVAAYCARKSSSVQKPTFPIGWWTLFERASSTLRVGAWATIARASEAAPSVTVGSADDPYIVEIHTYRGSSPNPQVDYSLTMGVVSQYSASATSITIVPAGSNYWPNPARWMLLVVAGAKTSAGMTITTANGYTSRGDQSSASGSGISLSTADILVADQGASIGTWPTHTISGGGSAEIAAVGLVIRPRGGA